MSATPELGTPWRIGSVEVPNRVLLAPLAGIGNWFVRLQAKRYGAAVAVARAAREGSGLPVTVKLRSGQRPGETDGYDLAHRLVHEAGVSAIGFHPRSAAVHHKGTPDYDLAARLVQSLDAPVILTGGLHTPAEIRAAHERTGAAAVMLARGSLGYPWLFDESLGLRGAP